MTPELTKFERVVVCLEDVPGRTREGLKQALTEEDLDRWAEDLDWLLELTEREFAVGHSGSSAVALLERALDAVFLIEQDLPTLRTLFRAPDYEPLRTAPHEP